MNHSTKMQRNVELERELWECLQEHVSGETKELLTAFEELRGFLTSTADDMILSAEAAKSSAYKEVYERAWRMARRPMPGLEPVGLVADLWQTLDARPELSNTEAGDLFTSHSALRTFGEELEAGLPSYVDLSGWQDTYRGIIENAQDALLLARNGDVIREAEEVINRQN